MINRTPRECLLISFDIKFIGLDQKHAGWLDKPRHSYAVSGLA